MTAEERMKETGRRILACRKELKLTQGQLLKALYMAPESLATMRFYERGERLPDLETLYRMCDLFQCDIEYLTAEIPTKRHVAADVCKETGLSARSVGILKNWSTPERLDALNLLLEDIVKRPSGKFHRPILDSISRYMNFPAKLERIYVDAKGQVAVGDRAGGETVDGTLFVSTDKTVLDAGTVADTILLEIQAALIAWRGEKGNGQHD